MSLTESVARIVRGAACAGAVVLLAAGAARGPSPENYTHGCVDHFDAGVDYFPDKTVVEDATQFSVAYRKSYKVVTVKVPYPGSAPERYVLFQCGTPPPQLVGRLAGAQLISIPITSLFSASTTQLSPLLDLHRLDVLTGVSALASVDEPEVLARARLGRITEFTDGGLNVDVERVVAAKPSVFMTSGTWSASFAVIRGAGIPVVADSEWLEPTGLARAEWIKYLALYLNEERQAASLYRAVKNRYEATRRAATSLPASAWPLVMTGRSSHGEFGIAGGRSYVAQFIKDAGGRYVWADNRATGFSSVDLEAEIRRAANADIWINGGGWKDRAAMLQDEPRYAEFKAFRTGQVWVYEKRQRPDGANDYWTRSVTHPDLVLLDLAKIFHPALLPGHVLEWYMKVPEM